MEFIEIPVEQTTSITDLILFFVSLATFLALRKMRSLDGVKIKIWLIPFLLLALAAFLGFVAHGFKMSAELNQLIWQPLNLFLGVTISFIGLGVIYDLNRFRISTPVVVTGIFLGIGFFVVTKISDAGFLLFIVFELVVMLFALVGYIILYVKKMPGALCMISGIGVTIIAAAIQALVTAEIQFIWLFDHNGIFHIVQIPGIYLLFLGIKKELISRHQK